MIGIYKITSPSKKVYIGQSRNIKKRWNDYSVHKKKQKDQTAIFYSLKKYGKENHVFEVIEECSLEELNEREIYYIEKYDSVNNGLNISRGGYYFWEVNVGKKHKKETIDKMKEYWAENAKPRSKETIAKISKTKQENPRITTPEMVEKYRKASTSTKSISQFDLEGNHISDFNSINEAARHLNIRNDGVSACLRGKQKTAYGYIWRYQ
jgi:group I intron endonuclease|tara:strand:- start:70 stop:696 length:627 start_codon:yes stop_codon:yes gene_type:complete